MMERAIRAFVPNPFVAALASIVALHNREYPMQEIEQCECGAYADPYGSFMVLHILMSPTSRFRGPDTLWRVPWNRLLEAIYSIFFSVQVPLKNGLVPV